MLTLLYQKAPVNSESDEIALQVEGGKKNKFFYFHKLLFINLL